MTDVWVNGKPIEQIISAGLNVTGLAKWTDLPAMQTQEIQVPRRAGSWLVSQGTTRAARTLDIQVEPILGGVVLGRQEIIGNIYKALAGKLDISIADDPYRFVQAFLMGSENDYYGPELAVPNVKIPLRFMSADPWYYDTIPTVLAVPASTRVSIPCGSASHGGVLRLSGAGSSPCTIIHRDRSGNELGRLTLTTTWTDSVYVEVDFDWGTIKKWTAGVASNAEDTIAVTETFFVFDPLDGPTIEYTGAVSGEYTYRKAYLA